MRSGPLARAIDAYKVQGKWGWSWVFGRVLLGYLNAHRETFSGYGLIVPEAIAQPAPLNSLGSASNWCTS